MSNGSEINQIPANGTGVHPIELTVQSLIESPLEILHLNLQSLYDSQTILLYTLKKLETKLDDSEGLLHSIQPSNKSGCETSANVTAGSSKGEGKDLDTDQYLNKTMNANSSNQDRISLAVRYKDNANRYADKIGQIKQRLQQINGVIGKVEQRVDKMIVNLGIEDEAEKAEEEDEDEIFNEVYDNLRDINA